jgi:hypothetical protein
MQKFQCNSCDNIFFAEAVNGITCPACGSNSIVLLTEEKSGQFWRSRTFIISMSVMAVMLLVLIFLPSANRPKKIPDVISVKVMPEQCRIIIQVKQGDSILDPGLFEYSVDNGLNWHRRNIYYSEIRRDKRLEMNVLVRRKDNTSEILEYNQNPVAYNPVARLKAQPVSGCRCEDLSILSVEVSNDRLTIHASPSACIKQYSIFSKVGPYQADSSFDVQKGMECRIFVKTDKCPPVGYAILPYKIPEARKDTSHHYGKFVEESQLDVKPLVPTCVGSREELSDYVFKKIGDDPAAKGLYRVSFIVETDGSLSTFSVQKGYTKEINDRIEDVLRSCGWQSGYVKGEYVRTIVRLTFVF